MDSVSARVERVEGELEYLENKIPTQSDIEMEEALLEQQIKAAELEQIKTKAKLNVENGGKSPSLDSEWVEQILKSILQMKY